MNSLDYRRDHRSKKEFKEDIRSATEIEKEIVVQYVRYALFTTGTAPKIESQGTDNTGKEIKSKASTKADYTFNGKPVEIKYNEQHLSKFHLKRGQLKSYIKQDAHILWVNGYMTDNPLFTILTPHDLRKIYKTDFLILEKWGNKEVHRLDKKDFRWKPLLV